jgi:hypothetical protein
MLLYRSDIVGRHGRKRVLGKIQTNGEGPLGKIPKKRRVPSAVLEIELPFGSWVPQKNRPGIIERGIENKTTLNH